MADDPLRELEARRGLSGLAAGLERAFAAGPDPEGTARRAAALLDAVGEAEPEGLAAVGRERPEALARALAALCGVAPFLARLLAGQPRTVLALAREELAEPLDLEAYEGRLERALAKASGEEVPGALRRAKYAELARITVRDASPDLVPEARALETLGELSALAEALLRRALAHAAGAIRAEKGPPEWRTASGEAVALRFAVLALGKLGAGELNYSSDVDLVYVFESPPEEGALAEGPGDLAPEEYFARLARRFGALVEERSAEGFLYRVDLELRPEGAQGPLVASSDSLAQYFDAWAAAWEKSAFMKARPVAGDLDFGWSVVRALAPMIYRSSMDFDAVSDIKEMKAKVERQHATEEGAFDVKLGAGGIRDVEFVVQAFQLLHGGRIPQVRGRSTARALATLGEVGLLAEESAEELLASYRFLRRVENRLQMEDERQTHRVPAAAEARERLGRALHLGTRDAREAFDARLEEHRRRVRERFDALFSEGDTDFILDLFARHAGRLLASASSRAMIEQLAERFARHIQRSADPERAMNGLARFIEGVGAHPFYYGLLTDRPELVPRLTRLFAASRYLSAVFASHPSLIEPVFRDPGRLLLSREELERDFEAIRGELDAEGRREAAELDLAALRFFQSRQLVNVGLLDLDGKVGFEAAERALTDLAEVCLGRGLEAAHRQLERTAPRSAARVAEGDFLVVGMGKLATRELSYGSDLDVTFLYDLEGAGREALLEAQEAFVRLAQKLTWALQTRTAEGLCYEVDTRLRPSGSQGVLVTSLASFERYHERSAQVWERQTLLRARPVAGSERLAEAFRRLRREILTRPLPEGLVAEVDRIRKRMETELARESGGHFDLKTGRGGLLDVETVVQLRQLQHGAAHPELLEPRTTAEQLEALRARDLLAPEQAEALREGWAFLQRLSTRLRVVENRSISDLSEDRRDLDALARALGYPTSARTGHARRALLEDYRRHTDAVRRVYDAVLGASD